MTNSRSPSDILNSYDFSGNTLKDNSVRENLIQEILQLLISATGFDFSSNSQRQIMLSPSQKSALDTYNALVAAGDKREILMVDPSTGKLTLINPNAKDSASGIIVLEVVGSTFPSGIILGENAQTPSDQALHGIAVYRQGGTITILLKQSDGSTVLLATQADITTVNNTITAINQRLLTAEALLQQHSATLATHTTEISGLTTDLTATKATVSSQGSSITAQGLDISKLKSDLGITERDLLALQQIVTTHTGDIISLQNSVNGILAKYVDSVTSTSPEIVITVDPNNPKHFIFSYAGTGSGGFTPTSEDGSIIIVKKPNNIEDFAVHISQAIGNSLTRKSDGLYASGGSSPAPATTVSAGQAISVVKNSDDYRVGLVLSTAAGNSASIDSNGLYVPPSAGGSTVVSQGDGTVVTHQGDTYMVAAHISTTANNQARIDATDKGIYVPAPTIPPAITVSGGDGATVTNQGNTYTVAAHISATQNNQAKIDATDKGIYVPAPTIPPAITVSGGDGTTVTHTGDNFHIASLISTDPNNIMKIGTDKGLLATVQPATVDSALDTVETIYISSTGQNTNDGRKVSTPVLDISNATVKAMALRSAASQNALNPVIVTSIPTETARDITGNFEATDGKLSYYFPNSNSDGLIITQNITTAAVTKLNTVEYEFNNIHNNSHFIVNVNADSTTIHDEFNLYIKCKRLEVDANPTNSFIQIKKGTGTGTTQSCVKVLNVILDIYNTEEINAVINDTAPPIVLFNQQDLSGMQVHVIYGNRTQDTSGVTQLATLAQPFQIVGTPDPNNACTLFVTATLPESRSQLYDFNNVTNYFGYNLRLQDRNILNSVISKALSIPSIASSNKASIWINGDLVSYNTNEPTSVKKNIATQDYVQDAIVLSKSKGFSAFTEAVHFNSYIRTDPVSNAMWVPNLTFKSGGHNYPDQASIDTTQEGFTIQEEFFGFRLDPLTIGTSTLPKQLQLDDWTGTAAGQTKAFYGIGRIKLMDTTLTVTDNTANTTEIEYSVAFTSTMSIADLQANLLPGIWFEISNVVDNKFVVGVISGKVEAGTGSNAFTFKANICFTNSKRTDLYTIANLSNKSCSIYLNPWPGIFPQEMKVFRSAVTDNALCHVQQTFYLSAYHSSDVVEEALLLTSYHPGYAAYANRATDPDWHKNIGKYQFSIGTAIPKIVIEKFKAVWSETQIKVGYCPCPIPSLTKGMNPGERTLVGIIIEDNGSSLSTSTLYSSTASNPLYWNMPSHFSGTLANISVANSKIACGLQLSSFVSGCYATTRVCFSKVDLDAVQLFTDNSTITSGGTLASFTSTAAFQSNSSSKAYVFDDFISRNILAVSSTASGVIKPFSNILGSSKAASNMTMYFIGISVPNALYSAISNHKIQNLEEPDVPTPVPSDADLIMIGNYTAAEATGNKGYFIKADGTAIGHLSNS